jgi:hypothetical protein
MQKGADQIRAPPIRLTKAVDVSDVALAAGCALPPLNLPAGMIIGPTGKMRWRFYSATVNIDIISERNAVVFADVGVVG